jgi:hypothetical protein
VYKKWAILLIVLLFPIQVIATSSSKNEPETEVSEVQEELSKQTLRFSSNQFTQPEKESKSVEVDTSMTNFEQVAENDKLKLYVNRDSLALKIIDKRTGYIWNSGLAENREYKLNDRWRNMANSAVTITYIDDKNKEYVENVFSEETTTELNLEENGFTAVINFKKADIVLQLEVELDGEDLVVRIPESKIGEGENGKLVSLRLYPFLGAVHGNEINGYMFIPDGSGALIRFDENSRANSPYQASVYGNDEGFTRSVDDKKDTQEQTSPPQKITMPVYGIVHEAKKNGLFTVIENGSEYGELIAYPSGVSTNFNWVTSDYHYRYQYFQPTSRSMSGYNTYQKNRNQFDIKERTTFLVKEDADYVGMAKSYQQYLVESGKLSRKKDEVDVRLEFLGGEVKEGILWDSVLKMTSINDLPKYVRQLQQQNVENMHIVYRGWTKGGLTGTFPEKFPIEKELGSKADYKDTILQLKKKDIPLYFYTDYTKAYEGAGGFSGSTDVARKKNGETMNFSTFDRNYFYLSPKDSLELAKKEIDDYKENSISKLAMDTSANVLFSDFNSDKSATRREMVDLYTDMHELLDKEVGSLSLYQPNDYLWSVTERYLDIPMYSSNYSFVTDTVPFIQIVLKGYIPYYAPFSNFHFNRDEEVLRMVEYGANPSFYLTTQSSQLLMNTPSRDLYTSEFDKWEDEIVRQYEMIQESLGEVEGASIESRYIHETGVVEVTYSNGKSIIVNYTNEPYMIDGIEVKAKWFKVLNKGDKTS